jgi:ferric enterobactin receptor
MATFKQHLSVLLTVCSILFLIQSVKAQSVPFYFSVKGKIVDSLSKSGAGWATIFIRNQVDETISSCVSDSTGSFLLTGIPKGDYNLQVISVGYANKVIPLKLQDTLGPHVDLGTLSINIGAKQLKEVEVRGSKPLVKQEIDRLVYDVQADPDSRGSNVLEMMRKVPFVSLDADQNILLKNNASFKIFINDKPSGMLEHNAKEVLRSMPASTIEKIQVITNPPAKYDAEGFAGIINIITSKQPSDGYKGTLNLNENFPAGGPGMGASISFKASKLMVSVFSGGSLSKTPVTANFLFRNTSGKNPTVLNQQGNRRSKSSTGYLGADLSYEISNVQLISTQINVSARKNSEFAFQQSALTTASELLQSYQLQNDYNNPSNNIDLTLNYQIGSNVKKERAFTFSYRYANYEDNSHNTLKFTERSNYPYSDFFQENQASANEHTFQVDYIDKFNKWGLESGAKTILRNNSSYYNYHANVSNDFSLSQNVLSAYTSLALTNKNWGLKGGVRAEQTLVGGDASQDYLHIVPSIALGLQLKRNNNFNAGFSQRLRRPGINRLNPFVDRSNPNIESSGNAALRPSVINNINLGYNHNGRFSVNIGLGYSFFNNLDFRIYTYDPATAVTKSTYANIGKGNAFVTDLYLDYKVTKDLNLNFNGNLTYLNVKPMGDLVPVTEGLYHNFTVSGGYRPVPVWRLSANLNIIGKMPASKSFQSITQGQINTSFSSSHALVKDKLDITLTLNNPFRKFRTIETHITGPDFYEKNNNQYYLRAYKFSLNYYFGRLKDDVRKTKRGIKNDDLSN